MSRIPVLRPNLPTADAILPWLRRIDQNRWYSNFGPLESELRHRLGVMMGLTSDNVGLFSSGTDALAVALRAMTGGQGVCVLPSWTHVGTATAISLAGLEPYFVDCDPATWAISPEPVLSICRRIKARAVVPVAPFGASFDYAGWSLFAETSGVSVVVDAAAGFDFAIAHGRSVRWGRLPVMVSLHATKAMGIGEGGVLVSADAELVRATQQLSNFGIWNQQPSNDAFANCKMSEYAAAVGMAALEAWPAHRERLVRLTAAVAKEWGGVGAEFSPGFAGNYISSTCMISLPGIGADTLEVELTAEGVETKRWWRHGVRELAAYQRAKSDSLENTRKLAEGFIGLPFYPDLTDDQVQFVANALRNVRRRTDSSGM